MRLRSDHVRLCAGLCAGLWLFVLAPSLPAADTSDAYQRGMFLYQNSYDYARARAELLRAATLDGLPEAAFYLAELYESGVAGEPPDPAAARRWYLFAAERGHVGAQQRTATLYLHGGDCPADAAAAFGWYLRAAEQGDLLSQFALSQLYAEGRGVKADAYEAYKWLAIAASFGYPNVEPHYALIAPRLTPEARLRAEADAAAWERARAARLPPAPREATE